MELYDPRTIRYIRNKFGFRFSKSLGQNFLIDKSVIDDIVEGAMVSEDDLVIEIGPGIGVLTDALLAEAGKVVAVELDNNLIKVLDFTLQGWDNLEVIHADILKTDVPALIREKKGELKTVKICGNLPYYITTPILVSLLKSRLDAESITVMMQKEVAERILAGPGSRTYGALSVTVQYYSSVSLIREVSKESFLPAPKVDSAVLRLDLRKEPAVSVKSEDMFFRVVRAGFGQRRKTLRNSLKQTGASTEQILSCLTQCGIAQDTRAEKLGLEEFACIADGFTEMGL